MYLVIECCDRALSQVKSAKDEAEAESMANELLKAHLANIGYSEAEQTELKLGLQRAALAIGETSAWCNLKEHEYDAFCFPVDIVESSNMLGLLAKEHDLELTEPGW